MFGTLERLVRDSFVYLVGAATIGFANLLLVPLYTHSLSPAEFGIYALIDVSVLVTVTLTQLGLGVSYLKWFAEVEPNQHNSLLGGVLLTSGMSGLVGGAVLWLALASGMWDQQMHHSLRVAGWPLLLIVVLESAQGVLLNDLRARRRSVAFVGMTLIRFLCLLGGSVWCVAVLHGGVEGVFVGRLIGDVGAVLGLLLLCVSSFSLRVNWYLVRSMIGYGLPLVWCSLIASILDASGRYFVSHYRGLEEAGLYGASVKISGLFQVLIVQPFGLAWGGLMFQLRKRPDAQVIYSRVLCYTFFVSLTAALILALFTPALMRIFATRAYAAAGSVLPLILLVRALSIMEYPAAIGLYLSGRTRWFVLIYSAGLAVGVSMNLCLGPRYGMRGVACSWAVAWASIAVTMLIVGQRYYPLQLRSSFFVLPALGWCILLLGRPDSDPGLGVVNWLPRMGIALSLITIALLVLRKDLSVQSAMDPATGAAR